MIKAVVMFLALGFVLSGILSWVFDITPQGIKRTADISPVEAVDIVRQLKAQARQEFVRGYLSALIYAGLGDKTKAIDYLKRDSVGPRSMILSHRYKFIFIKTAKTAGTSIEVFLSKHCGLQDIVTPIMPRVEGHQPRNYEGLINPVPEILERPGKFFSALRHTMTSRTKFYNHMPAREVKQRVPVNVWNGYFKFCVERNPWDKALSHYHMHAAREGGGLSLDEYLARGRFPVNDFRYLDRSRNKIIVDRIVRFENLLADLGEVFAQLNIPFDGTLGVAAKSEYRADRRPYQEVFNEQQRRIVEKAFAKEIELHGYRFGA